MTERVVGEGGEGGGGGGRGTCQKVSEDPAHEAEHHAHHMAIPLPPSSTTAIGRQWSNNPFNPPPPSSEQSNPHKIWSKQEYSLDTLLVVANSVWECFPLDAVAFPSFGSGSSVGKLQLPQTASASATNWCR